MPRCPSVHGCREIGFLRVPLILDFRGNAARSSPGQADGVDFFGGGCSCPGRRAGRPRGTVREEPSARNRPRRRRRRQDIGRLLGPTPPGTVPSCEPTYGPGPSTPNARPTPTAMNSRSSPAATVPTPTSMPAGCGTPNSQPNRKYFLSAAAGSLPRCYLIVRFSLAIKPGSSRFQSLLSVSSRR